MLVAIVLLFELMPLTSYSDFFMFLTNFFRPKKGVPIGRRPSSKILFFIFCCIFYIIYIVNNIFYSFCIFWHFFSVWCY